MHLKERRFHPIPGLQGAMGIKGSFDRGARKRGARGRGPPSQRYFMAASPFMGDNDR